MNYEEYSYNPFCPPSPPKQSSYLNPFFKQTDPPPNPKTGKFKFDPIAEKLGVNQFKYNMRATGGMDFFADEPE